VLEAFGLLVDLVPGDLQDVGQEALDHAVAAGDLLGLGTAVLGQVEDLVVAAGDVAVTLEPLDHLVDRGR